MGGGRGTGEGRGGGRESLDARRVSSSGWRRLGAGGRKDAGGVAGMMTKALRRSGGGGRGMSAVVRRWGMSALKDRW